jgi:hypothetical protein
VPGVHGGHASACSTPTGNDTTLIRGEAVEVPDTLYYRRQIACGDLVVVPADAPAPSAKAGG